MGSWFSLPATVHFRARVLSGLVCAATVVGCGGGAAPQSAASAPSPSVDPVTPPIYVVIFTHIEDNTPAATLGSAESRANYLVWRSRTIQMAQLARRYSMTWVLQPDWKYLEAARLYEDNTTLRPDGAATC